jgi:hypothetical protein
MPDRARLHRWACPGEKIGLFGFAKDDGTEGFNCCCKGGAAAEEAEARAAAIARAKGEPGVPAVRPLWSGVDLRDNAEEQISRSPVAQQQSPTNRPPVAAVTFEKSSFAVAAVVRPEFKLDFYADGGMLYVDGEPLSLKGVTWFGSESRRGPPLGLDVHSIGWYMTFLRENGFNAVRLLFNHEDVLADSPLDPPDEAKYGGGAPWESKELAHMSYLDMFVAIASAAAEHGILVMLSCHRLTRDAHWGGLWFSYALNEQRVYESWAKLIERTCDQWNVFAAGQRP